MPYEKIEDIYSFLKPKTIGESIIKDSSKDIKKDFGSIVSESILSENGVFRSFSDIKTKIEDHLSKDRELKDTDKIFNFISMNEAILSGPGKSNSDYWSDLETKSLTGIIKPPGSDKSLNISAAIVKSKTITPAMRGTSPIAIFLNYMPSIMLSQMVPYLDIRFKINHVISSENKSADDVLNTPSQIRFLLGSVPVSGLSNSDKYLSERGAKNTKIKYKDSEKKEINEETTTQENSIGMESFLMPQSLTNMDGLSGTSRLTKAKPFVPFVSINGFDINVINAGAGTFAHRRASLKLTIHDKSRVSEFSELIRGPAGFGDTIIETAYGWNAPENREDDKYFQFINENMKIIEHWKIVNSQFSFDLGGQATVTLDLMSHSGNFLINKGLSAKVEKLKEFSKAIQKINYLKAKYQGDKRQHLPANSEKIFNAISGEEANLDDIPDLDKTIDEIVAVINKLEKSNIDDDTKEALEKLKGFKKKGDYSYDNLKSGIQAEINTLFNNLNVNKDPFLAAAYKHDPGEASGIIGKYCENYIKSLNIGKKLGANIVPKDSKTKTGTKSTKTASYDMANIAPVVSFGKLFLNFFAPVINEEQKDKKTEEIQIFFYNLNDECGPASELNIAEFPIRMDVLINAYGEMLKKTKTESLTMQQFLTLVIETNFSDRRALPYGMTEYYKLDKQELSEDDKSKKGMLGWIDEWGEFKPPQIEMMIESGSNLDQKVAIKTSVTNFSNDRTKFITRIHIYDKTCNPFENQQTILRTSDGFEVGKINHRKLVKILKEKIKKETIGNENVTTTYNTIKDSKSEKSKKEAIEKFLTESFTKTIYETAGTVGISNKQTIKNWIMSSVPSISIGSNGGTITSCNVATKTDSVQASINAMNAAKGYGPGGASPTTDNLDSGGGMPIRATPVQVTLTSLGVPNAQLYQSYFIDFDTGTSIDNIYNCTGVSHSISPGKFTTNWTFMYTDGYARLGGAPSITSLTAGEFERIYNEVDAEVKAEKAKTDKNKKQTSNQ